MSFYDDETQEEVVTAGPFDLEIDITRLFYERVAVERLRNNVQEVIVFRYVPQLIKCEVDYFCR